MPTGIYLRTEYHKKRISSGLKGKSHSAEHNKKVSEALKGRTLSLETCKKISNAKKGIKNPHAGVKRSGETKIKIGLALLGRKHPPLSEESRQNIRDGQKKRFETQSVWNKGIKYLAITGDKHRLWISDRTHYLEKRRLRGTLEWANWRKNVFERDDYTCQECNERGGKLEPHHVIPLRLDMTKIFEITNGITLCRKCHEKTIKREEQFVDKYSSLINLKEKKE